MKLALASSSLIFDCESMRAYWRNHHHMARVSCKPAVRSSIARHMWEYHPCARNRWGPISALVSFPSLANQGLTTVLVLELVLAFIHLAVVIVLGSPKAACISVSLSSTDFWCTREDQLPRYAAQRKRLLLYHTTTLADFYQRPFLPTHTLTHGSNFFGSLDVDANAGKIQCVC